MLFLLSPAKSLDYEAPGPAVTPTKPLFTSRASELISVLRDKSPQQVASLMDLSDKLAALNVARYQAWSARPNPSNARPAVLAFDGDVYDGLQARALSVDELQWAQDHLCILSGLYGVLRPLDLMQPYRLEMGTALQVGSARNLYEFWGGELARYLNKRVAADASPVIVNLASQEYFRSVDRKILHARVVECVFEDQKGDTYKVVSFWAKKARGLMARWAITHRVATPRGLEAFDLEGYRFTPEVSNPERLVFRRTMQA